MTRRQQCKPNAWKQSLPRLYEPLVLLHVLDTIQGEHIARSKDDLSYPDRISKDELRRRFLDELSYVCDYKKGGDTMTAIFVSSTPLTYYIATNKNSFHDGRVLRFLRDILQLLAGATKEGAASERRILKKCTSFSKDRILVYQQFLRTFLEKCLESNPGFALSASKYKSLSPFSANSTRI